jgi:hypothetical protein
VYLAHSYDRFLKYGFREGGRSSPPSKIRPWFAYGTRRARDKGSRGKLRVRVCTTNGRATRSVIFERRDRPSRQQRAHAPDPPIQRTPRSGLRRRPDRFHLVTDVVTARAGLPMWCAGGSLTRVMVFYALRVAAAAAFGFWPRSVSTRIIFRSVSATQRCEYRPSRVPSWCSRVRNNVYPTFSMYGWVAVSGLVGLPFSNQHNPTRSHLVTTITRIFMRPALVGHV